MAISDYLSKLVALKNQLVANLTTMGVTAEQSEKLNTLVPKVLDIKTGVDTSDATATAEDIAAGKTAYVGGERVTGNKEEVVQNVEFFEGTDFTYGSNVSETGLAKAIKKLVIPDSTTTIGKCAFKGTSLQSVIIPNSVTTIGDNAFECCNALRSITIPDGVISIGNYAFKECKSLEEIYIPSTVTSLGIRCFVDNSYLAHIYYTGTETQWNAIKKGGYWDYTMGSKITGGTQIHYNYTG